MVFFPDYLGQSSDVSCDCTITHDTSTKNFIIDGNFTVTNQSQDSDSSGHPDFGS